MDRRTFFRFIPGAAAAAVFAGSSAALAASVDMIAPSAPLSLIDWVLEFGQYLDEQDMPAYPGRYIILTPFDVVKLNGELGNELYKQPTYDYEPLGCLDRFRVYGTITELQSWVGYDATGEAGQRVKPVIEYSQAGL